MFGYHTGYNLHLGPAERVLPDGYAGVGFFFVLSGFVLSWSHRPAEPVRRFYRRRFARIYPSHLTAALISLAAVGGASGVVVAVALLLVQPWFALSVGTSHLVTLGLNPPSWSLGCEAFFYAAFPLLLALVAPRRPAIAAGFGWAAGWAVAVLVATLAHPSLWVLENAYFDPVVRSGEFVAGIALCRAMQRGWRPRWRMWHALVVGVASVVVCRVADLHLPTADPVLLPAFLMLLSAAAAADIERRPGMLTRRAWVYAGSVSYAFYLVQYAWLVRVPDWTRSPWPASAVALAGTCLSAVVLHHGVEVPGLRLLTRRRMTEPLVPSM